MQRFTQFSVGQFLVGLFATCGLAACDNPVDTNANHIPLQSDDVVADTGNDTTTAPACDCIHEGDWYRFTALQLTNVDGDPDFAVIPVLNSLWQSDIDNFELNFLVQISKVATDSIEIDVTSGARVGDTKHPCLLPQTKAHLKFPRNGCSLLKSEPGSMNVYAGSIEHPKNCGYLQNVTPKIGADHAIPIRGVVLQANATPDCKTIENGIVLEGSFSKAALFHLCTCQTTPGQSSDVCITPQPSPADASKIPESDCSLCGNNWQSLGGLLSAFAGDAGLKYGCKSDTGGPSVCMGATFKAERLDPAVWLPTECSATK